MGSNQAIFEILLEQKIRAARTDFFAFRQLMNPGMKDGWWQREVAGEFQGFAEDLIAGLSPSLIVEAPPQHGKSIQVIDLIAWIAGKAPHLKTIYTSFSNRLGIRANLRLRRIYANPIYGRVFPCTHINGCRDDTPKSDAIKSAELLEYVGDEGSFRNTTVNGSITGESLDLGVIDDPIKGRKDANSKTIRDGAWDWFTDDFMTRFSEGPDCLASSLAGTSMTLLGGL
jgi:Uncharacterized protein conserved in bacteria